MISLPKAMPGESLFSRYIRHLKLTGLCKDQYCIKQFGRPRLSIHPFITAGVRHAASEDPDKETLIFNTQTLGGLFCFFMPNQTEVIKQALLATDTATAIRACRLVNYTIQSGSNAKYCPLCANEDAFNFGFSYWHLEHQIPGVNCCSKHGVQLIQSLLPERPHIDGDFLPPVKKLSATSHPDELMFARSTVNFLNDLQYKPEGYKQDELIIRLAKAGYIGSGGRVRRRELISDLMGLTKSFSQPSRPMLPKHSEDFGYIRSIMKNGNAQHPFKYLLLEYLLSTRANVSSGNYVSKADSPDKDHKQLTETCIQLLNQSYSLAEVSRLTGKSRTFLKMLAAKENIQLNLSPKKITKSLINKVIRIAWMGFHRNAIASTFQISNGSVEQIISSVNGLVEHRKKCRFESKRRRYRAEILRALSGYVYISPSKEQIKKAHYAAFHWLYRNDKTWLNNHLPKPQKPKQNPRVDWRRRDQELAVKVQAILLNTQEKLSLKQLDDLLGAHGWLTRKLDKLPTTSSMIESLQNTRSKIAK
ncbi:TnsD family Tn7-like transposition protein [Planctobacterium marinum]|uniref:TnsD family Tn7-like transposition protein n=1 Tax=Planctobacterium marinum TaxID=1631968 RepID=UPI0030C677C6